MKLILVRHGESEWNRINRYQGQNDPPLSELGRKQAEAIAKRLSDEQIAVIFTSPLLRAAHTGDAIASFHPSIPVIREHAITEIDHGDWSGCYASDIAARWPDGLREWRETPTRSQMPNGESFSNVLKRVLDFRDRIVSEYAGKTVVIAAHDVIVKILAADALGMHMDRMNTIWAANAALNVLDYSARIPILVCLNDTGHLGELAVRRESQQSV